MFSSSTRFGSPESGVNVTVLDVEYTGRRNSFPAHKTSLSPEEMDM